MLKIDIKHGKVLENMATIEHKRVTKKIMKCVIASHKINIMYLFFWHSNLLDISQGLEVVRNGKNGIFLPNLTKIGPNKCPF